MAVRVDRRLAKRIRDNPWSIVVQVQEASDPEAALDALVAAGAEIAALDGGWESVPGLSPGDTNGPKYVSAVTPSPTGPYLYVDGGHTPPPLLATIPAIIARHVAGAGVAHAKITAPPSHQGPSKFSREMESGRAVALHLYPPPVPLVPVGQRTPRGRIPPEWYDAAVEWVRSGLGDDDLLWASGGTVGFAVAAREARATVAELKKTGNGFLMSGDFPSRIRATLPSNALNPVLAVGGGGSEVTDDELLEMARSLVALARSLAPSVAHALVQLDDRLGLLYPSSPLLIYPPRFELEPPAPDSVASPGQVEDFSDELLVEAFPYQILGPGHLHRLGEGFARRGPHHEVRALGGDRYELTIGDLASWLPGSPRRDEVREAGRALLAPCLLTASQVSAIWYERRGIDFPIVTEPRPQPVGDDDESEYIYVIRVLPVIVPTYRRIVAGTETIFEAGVLPQPVGPLELHLDFGDGTSARQSVEPGPEVVTLTFSKTYDEPGEYTLRLETTQPKTIIDGEVHRVVSEASVDVDPSPDDAG